MIASTPVGAFLRVADGSYVRADWVAIITPAGDAGTSWAVLLDGGRLLVEQPVDAVVAWITTAVQGAGYRQVSGFAPSAER